MAESILGVEVGRKASFSKTVSEGDIAAFADVTGDSNPLHLDADHAARTRFKQRVAHGMLSAGFVSAALGTKLAGPDVTVVYLSQNMRFLRPVFIGDTVTANVEVKSLDSEKRFVTVATECVNQKGESVLTGEAVVLLDAVQ
jgi:3-hydroxybutyryl-CoA dehydratase